MNLNFRDELIQNLYFLSSSILGESVLGNDFGCLQLFGLGVRDFEALSESSFAEQFSLDVFLN